MDVVPLQDFQHGSRRFVANVAHDVPDSLATDLERAGLVRVKMAAPLQNKMQPDADPNPGKALADGEGTPSASSQAAPASQTTIAPPLKRGRGRPRTKGI